MRKILTILLFLCVPASGQLFMPKQKPMLGLQVNWTHPASKGLKLFLLENEGSGNKVFDLSGNGRNGTESGGAIWVPGQHGPALEFDGDNDYIITPNMGGYSEISIILKVTALAQVDGGWVNINSNSGGDTFTGLRWDATDRVTANIGDGTNYYYGVSSTGSMPINVPVHIAMTGVAGSYPDLYINGVYDFSGVGSSGAPITTSSGPVYIGTGSKGYAKCRIEYVLIYNRALSASEIALLYREPFCMFKRDAIAILQAGSFTVPDWIGIDSSHLFSVCGEDVVHTLASALNGTDYWEHVIDHAHEFVVDLGQTYNVQKVRGRSNLAGDPQSVQFYVSDDTGDWGVAVGNISGPPPYEWEDVGDGNFVEINTTDKNGRYVRVNISSTEHPNDNLLFGYDPAKTIFDVYVAATVPTAGQIIFINFF